MPLEWHGELSCDLWETVNSPGEGKKAGGEVRGEMRGVGRVVQEE